MPDSRPSVEGLSTITSITTGRKDTRRLAPAIAQAPEHELLIYMGLMLSEIEAMATAADMDALADLLGYAKREVGRTEAKLRSPS